ncbi:hypothetical protein NL676_029821 [Syzygium grande]|nr:hypothetical protein NL676_029821 [Syzygium grande]
MFTRLNGMMLGTSTLHGNLESSKAPSRGRFEEILVGFNELEFIDGAHTFEAQAPEHRDLNSPFSCRVLTIMASGQHRVDSCSLLAQLHHLRSGFD